MNNLPPSVHSGGQTYRLKVKCDRCNKSNLALVEEEWDTNAIIVDEVCEFCGAEFSDKALTNGKYIEP